MGKSVTVNSHTHSVTLIERFGIYHTKMFGIYLFVGRFSLLLRVWALLAEPC